MPDWFRVLGPIAAAGLSAVLAHLPNAVARGSADSSTSSSSDQ
jgi:hypothetical protein